MKQSYRFLFVAFMLLGILLSACGAAAKAAPGAQKVSADIILTGTLESMDGTQWVVNGQAITVDPSVIKDGPFIVGDLVKVEGVVQPDGTFVVTRVETTTADDLATAEVPAADNSNDANSNDTNINDDNGNDDNSNSINSNDDDSDDANVNDDNSNGNTNINDANGDDDSNASNGNDNSSTENSNDDNGGGSGGGGDDTGGSNSNDS